MANLNCPQLNRVIDLDPQKSVMANLLDHGIQVASSCGGDGICGKCRMRIDSQAPLPVASALERRTLEKNGGEPGQRLSCQLFLKAKAMAETTYW
jgi:2Fe-2S ferredoxin